MEVRFGLGSWSVFSLWENLRIRLAFMIEGYCYASEMVLEYKNRQILVTRTRVQSGNQSLTTIQELQSEN